MEDMTNDAYYDAVRCHQAACEQAVPQRTPPQPESSQLDAGAGSAAISHASSLARPIRHVAMLCPPWG